MEDAYRRLGCHNLLTWLRPGLAPEQVRSVLGAAGLPADPDLEVLYGWRNGVSDDTSSEPGEWRLYPFWRLLPLGEALAARDMFIKIAEEEPEIRWDPCWLPILDDNAGGYELVELGGQGSARVRLWMEDPDVPIEYESVGDMLATVAAAFDAGIIFADGEGYLGIDFDRFASLARRLNPAVEYWRHWN
jgi:hypothetical protein